MSTLKEPASSRSNENLAVILALMGLSYMKFGVDLLDGEDGRTDDGAMFACYGFSPIRPRIFANATRRTTSTYFSYSRR